MHDERDVLHGLQERGGVAHHGKLIAGTVNPHKRLVGLAGSSRIHDGRNMRSHPIIQALMLNHAQTTVDNFLGRRELVGTEQVEREQEIRAERLVLARLNRITLMARVAHERFYNSHHFRSLSRLLVLVGRNAQANARMRRSVDIQLNGLFDVIGAAPCDFSCLFQRPFLRHIPNSTICRTTLLAIYVKLAVKRKVNIRIGGIAHSNGSVLGVVPNDIVGLISQTQLVSMIKQLGFLINQKRQVRPLLAPLLVVGASIHDIANPA